jgi:epoxyqueuosine reductase
MNKNERTTIIKNKAIALGFQGISIAKAEFMEPEARRLEQWLNQNHHGEMSYMANHFDKRVDPSKLVPGAKSVICLMYNYFTEDTLEQQEYKIASYAFGKDYHIVVKEKLNQLFDFIRDIVGNIEGRCFVDSAPILERDLAKKSGLGWTGKNTLLIHPKKGSYFFLGEIILDLELEYDLPIKDYCGTCTRCIEACPTDAISKEGYLLDSRKCISYLTIELKNEIPLEFKDQMEGWIFGCDICQQVCPWNRFSTPHKEDDFKLNEDLKSMTSTEWESLDQEIFSKLFSKSPVKRTKLSGLLRNITHAKG